MKIKILPDIKVENPCKKCSPSFSPFNRDDCNHIANCPNLASYVGQRSILSEVREIDIDAAYMQYEIYIHNPKNEQILFSQFLEQIKQSEG